MLNCIAILGPTCSGKSSVAMALAQQLGSELVSCDSMQVYRGMDIGTAKPTLAERQQVRHHLVDCVSIHERYDTNIFLHDARRIFADRSTSAPPLLLAGGTGLYARALLYDLPLLPADREVFEIICQQAATPQGLAALGAELAAADPQLAQYLQANPRRLMRAVEVLRVSATATALAPLQNQGRPRQSPLPGCRQFILLPEPEAHRQWISQRTSAMLAAGWIDETAALVSQGWCQSPTAQQALGYREIATYLAGEPQAVRSTAELRQRLIQRTWQYVRRQRTWFRHQHPGATIVELAELSAAAATAAVLAAGGAEFLTSY